MKTLCTAFFPKVSSMRPAKPLLWTCRILLTLFLCAPMFAQNCTTSPVCHVDDKGNVVLAPAQTSPAPSKAAEPAHVCWDGFESTKQSESECKIAHGDWIEDQTGKSGLEGDGCHTITCENAACTFSSETLVACAYHPIQINLAPPAPEKAASPPANTIMFSGVDMNADYVPFDVPPISEEYWEERIVTCMDTCPAPRTSTTPVDGWDYYTRLTCADKTRFLMTAEDGSKHCLALSPQPKGGSK